MGAKENIELSSWISYAEKVSEILKRVEEEAISQAIDLSSLDYVFKNEDVDLYDLACVATKLNKSFDWVLTGE